MFRWTRQPDRSSGMNATAMSSGSLVAAPTPLEPSARQAQRASHLQRCNSTANQHHTAPIQFYLGVIHDNRSKHSHLSAHGSLGLNPTGLLVPGDVLVSDPWVNWCTCESVCWFLGAVTLNLNLVTLWLRISPVIGPLSPHSCKHYATASTRRPWTEHASSTQMRLDGALCGIV